MSSTTTKRKLPTLNLSDDEESKRKDDSTSHQGRIRTQPHVKGQWACHIYLELLPSEILSSTLESIISILSIQQPSTLIHSLLPTTSSSSSSSTSNGETSLHLSLSRPLLIQTNQLERLKTEVGKLIRSSKEGEFIPFGSRFAKFSVLENDEMTRTFLGLEIGQGWDQIKKMVDELNSMLSKFRLGESYYDNPIFHTSIAWSSLLSESSTSLTSPSPLDPLEVTQEEPVTKRRKKQISEVKFSEEDLNLLEVKFGKQLRSEEIWTDSLCLKIGKEVLKFKLQ